jgi:GT2 family glycosyltransferase
MRVAATAKGEPSERAKPTLAVVIPATDRPATLDRCLAALRAGARQPDGLIVQETPTGAGPAAARNAGVARSDADVVVFVDSDVEVHPDALARIERHFAADASLTAVFGAYDQAPASPGLTSRFRNLLHHHVHAAAAGEAETFWAGLGAVRRERFVAVGGFDAARYPEASIEDVELGMRLRAAGGRIVLDPEVGGCHLKRWTPLSMVRTDLWRRGVPWARLLLREGGDRGSLNLGWRHRLGAAGSVLLLVAVLAHRPRLALAVLLGGLALHRDLYALLARRGGPRLLLAGVGLHQLHQLTAAASLPIAALLHVRERSRL